MHAHVRPTPRLAVGALLAAATLAGCGGGGGGSDAPVAPTLRYVDLRVEGATGAPLGPLTPVTTNLPVGATFAVTPSLPAGLAVDPLTGVLAGTPTALATAATYEVTAGGARTAFELRVSAPSRLLVSGSAVDGTLLVEGLEAETGATRTLDLVAPPTGLPPITDLAYSVAAGVVAVAHGTGGQPGTLVVYDLAVTTGALVERGRAALGLGPHRVVLLGDGSAAYVTDAGDDRLRAFALGVGAPVQVGAPRATGDDPRAVSCVTTMGGADVIVTANRTGATLSSFLVAPGNHGISTATASFVLNGGRPSAVAAVGDGESLVITLDNLSLAATVRVDAVGALSAVFGGAQTGLGPSAVAVHPTGALALVANAAEDSVTVLALDPTNATQPLDVVDVIPVQPGPSRITFDGAGRFAYVASAATGELTILRVRPEGSPRIVVAGRARLRVGAAAVATVDGATPFRRELANLYVVDEADDLLTILAPQGAADVLTAPAAPLPTGDRARGAALAPDGRTLFVVAEGAAQVEAFPLDGNGIPGVAVVSATASLPTDVAIAPGGRVAVVASQSPPLVTSYAIDGTGALTQIDVEVLPAPPGRVVIDPVGRTVIATAVASGQIVTFPLSEDGHLGAAVATVSAAGVPRALAFTPDGRHLLTALESQDRVAVHALGVDDQLTPVPPAGVDGSATGDRPIGVTVHPRGEFALAAVIAGGGVAGSTGNGSVDVLALDGATGALSQQDSLVIGLGPVDVAFEPLGGVAYALNRTGRDLSILRFDSATGGLSSAGAVPLGTRPGRLVVRDVVQ